MNKYNIIDVHDRHFQYHKCQALDEQALIALQKYLLGLKLDEYLEQTRLVDLNHKTLQLR